MARHYILFIETQTTEMMMFDITRNLNVGDEIGISRQRQGTSSNPYIVGRVARVTKKGSRITVEWNVRNAKGETSTRSKQFNARTGREVGRSSSWYYDTLMSAADAREAHKNWNDRYANDRRIERVRQTLDGLNVRIDYSDEAAAKKLADELRAIADAIHR